MLNTHSRARRRARQVPMEEAPEPRHDVEPDSQRLAKQQFLAGWGELMAKLPPEQVRAYVLVRLEGHTVAEAAQLTGISEVKMTWHVRAAKKALCPALERLRTQLGRSAPADEES